MKIIPSILKYSIQWNYLHNLLLQTVTGTIYNASVYIALQQSHISDEPYLYSRIGRKLTFFNISQRSEDRFEKWIRLSWRLINTTPSFELWPRIGEVKRSLDRSRRFEIGFRLLEGVPRHYTRCTCKPGAARSMRWGATSVLTPE